MYCHFSADKRLMKEPIRTLIIGYELPLDLAALKSRDRRNVEYFSTFLAEHDLGELHFVTTISYKEKLTSVNPFIAIVFDEWTAKEVKECKKDIFVYVTDSPNIIFYRKAEVVDKQEKQRRLFTEIVGLVQKIRDEGEEQREVTRKVAAMNYNDTYKMIVQMIVSEREDWRKQAWELLNDNNGRSSFVWMRVQLLCEVWEGCDAKGREEFLTMAMNQHIENGLAHALSVFTDLDVQQFHQYMFHYADGSNTNYIRRIPIAQEGQDKHVYDSLLYKYETPNGVQILLEAGQMKQEKEKFLKVESTKIMHVLLEWKSDPTKSKKILGVRAATEDVENEPLTELEVRYFKDKLQAFDPTAFAELFPQSTP